MHAVQSAAYIPLKALTVKRSNPGGGMHGLGTRLTQMNIDHYCKQCQELRRGDNLPRSMTFPPSRLWTPCCIMSSIKHWTVVSTSSSSTWYNIMRKTEGLYLHPWKKCVWHSALPSTVPPHFQTPSVIGRCLAKQKKNPAVRCYIHCLHHFACTHAFLREKICHRIIYCDIHLYNLQ